LKRNIVLFIAGLMLLISCSTPNETGQQANIFAMKITWTDSSQESYSLTIPAADVFGAWVSDTLTCVQLSGSEKSAIYSILMFISGTNTDNYRWANAVIFPDMTINMDINSLDYFFSDSGFTQVTKYEDVGGRIEGRFEGEFLRRSDLFGEPFLIEGEFSLIRLEDNRVVGN